MFFTWVDVQRAAGRIPPGPRRITRGNVDLFFQSVLVHKPWSKPVMRKMISSLQMYANMREHAGEDFIVESPLVQQAIKSQQKSYEAYMRQRNTIRDPLADLKTDMLKHEDRIRFMHHVLRTNNPQWIDFVLTFTGCEQMMVRKETMDKWRLCCHHLNDTHGPKETGDYDRKMLAVAQDPFKSKSTG